MTPSYLVNPNGPLPVMGLPVWKVVLLGWMVYGAGFGWGCTAPCLGIMSTQAEVGAPFGKDRTDVKTCRITPKNTASMILETGIFNSSFAIVQCNKTNLYTLSQIMPWTIDFWKALLLSHNCIKLAISCQHSTLSLPCIKYSHGVRWDGFPKEKCLQFQESVIDLDIETKTSSVRKEMSMENLHFPCSVYSLSYCCNGRWHIRLGLW